MRKTSIRLKAIETKARVKKNEKKEIKLLITMSLSSFNREKKNLKLILVMNDLNVANMFSSINYQAKYSRFFHVVELSNRSR